VYKGKRKRRKEGSSPKPFWLGPTLPFPLFSSAWATPAHSPLPLSLPRAPSSFPSPRGLAQQPAQRPACSPPSLPLATTRARVSAPLPFPARAALSLPPSSLWQCGPARQLLHPPLFPFPPRHATASEIPGRRDPTRARTPMWPPPYIRGTPTP
jgi:hypothetical protein